MLGTVAVAHRGDYRDRLAPIVGHVVDEASADEGARDGRTDLQQRAAGCGSHYGNSARCSGASDEEGFASEVEPNRRVFASEDAKGAVGLRSKAQAAFRRR